MAATTQFPWELLSQIKDHPTMERLESACDTGLYYGARLAHHISEAKLDDECYAPSDKTFLLKCMTENGKNTLLLYSNLLLGTLEGIY